MRTIYKYQIEIKDTVTIEMPQEAKVLKFGFQNDILCMWVLIDNSRINEHRSFNIYGTGHPCDRSIADYEDTVFDPRGFVWHIFKK